MAASYKTEGRYAGGLRSGQDYMDAIKNDGRRVFLDGEEISDVTSHPAFAEAVRSIADLFDIAHDGANRDVMTYPSPATGAPVNVIWRMPESHAELAVWRGAVEKWSESNFGLIGRGPDHVAGFFAGWASAPEVFNAGEGDRDFAANMVGFYEFLRDNDVYITYTIVPPQIDRSKPAHQQSPPDLYAGVTGERDDGIIIQGAQMLGTGAALSDYINLSTISPMQPGDDNHAINLAVACNAPGVRIHSRRSYAAAASSTYDYPLASRFDETDALVVFDNVFVPWEQVFVYKDLEICQRQWWETPAHIMGNNQAHIRFTTKLRFMMGVAHRVAGMNGVLANPAVQAHIAEIAALASLFEGLLEAQFATAAVNKNGHVEPGYQAHYAAEALQSDIYPKMLNLMRELCGGGVIQLPSSAADFANPEIRRDLERYVQSPGYPAEERVKLMKLAWDLIGSEFAGRHEQYEKFYAGPPFITRRRLFQHYDFEKSGALVDAALAGYDLVGRLPRSQ
jgi:4-hydroxyphenylacetate 3-monooxygenase